MPESWALLFKFGKKRHVEKFRLDGLLYMNPIAYFAKREACLNVAQADPFEGAEQIVQPRDLKSLIVGSGEDKIVLGPEHFVGPIRLSLGRTPPPNIFCMFALTDPARTPIVDPRNFALGDSFVMVRNTDNFIRRVHDAATSAGHQIQWGPVEYFSENDFSGDTGAFKKPSRFRYQNEFRFAVYSGSSGPIELPVGDLSDITTDVFPLNEINELIQIRSE